MEVAVAVVITQVAIFSTQLLLGSREMFLGYFVTLIPITKSILPRYVKFFRYRK